MKNHLWSFALLLLVYGCSENKEKNDSLVTSVDSVSVGVVPTTSAPDSLQMEMEQTINEIERVKRENDSLRNVLKPKEMDFSVRTSYMDNIDWMHASTEAPARMYCMLYVVTGDGSQPKVRTNASARECVYNSIRAYKANRFDGALNWLCAGQCHNPPAQDDLRNNAQAAVQYAYQTYGKYVAD